MWVHPPVGPARLPEQGLSWLPPEDLTLLTCRSEAKASSDSFHLAEGRTLRAFRKENMLAAQVSAQALSEREGVLV